MRFQNTLSASLVASLALAHQNLQKRGEDLTAWLDAPSTCRVRTVYTTVTVVPGTEGGANQTWTASADAKTWEASETAAKGASKSAAWEDSKSATLVSPAESSDPAVWRGSKTGTWTEAEGASNTASWRGSKGAGGDSGLHAVNAYGTYTWDADEPAPTPDWIPVNGPGSEGWTGGDSYGSDGSDGSDGSYASVSGTKSYGGESASSVSGGGYVAPSGSASKGGDGKPSATSSHAGSASHSTAPFPHLGKPCAGNTASTRDQWCDHDLTTDYYTTTPYTGVVREYFFNLEESVAAPDGWPRTVQSINGQIPGPTIYADWGDEVVVHFKNSLSPESLNGSSLHFHGIQQKDTNSMDGANSVTQCPTAPGDTYTYRWTATAYGSSWYHGHFGFQAWNGVHGGIVINGPASANYDVDVGTITLSDWNHWTADELFVLSDTYGPVTQLTGLIGGKNKWNTSISSTPNLNPGPPPGAPPPPAKRSVSDNSTIETLNVPAAVNTTIALNTTSTNSSELIGEYYKLKFEAGVSYRLRLVNVAIDSGFKFSIDGHSLTVIATDFVPIEPYVTDMIALTMGQRYDVIVKADQTDATDYWIRAIPQKSCSANSNQLGIKGIVHYGDSTAEPTTTAYDYTDDCLDEPAASLVPIVAKNVGPADYATSENVNVAKDSDNFFEWTLNGTSFLVNWNNPMLLNVLNNDSASIANQSNLIVLPKRDEWFYLLISEAGPPVPHPIHLHGHDFYVLGAGLGAYSGQELQLTNPPRRDTAMLPGGGWLMLAWQADNPGAWLMHCHIGWHTLEGFALQFLELEDEIVSTPGVIDDQLTGTCDKWNAYAEEYNPIQGLYNMNDSGL